jgi:Mg2+ and Co2+ transporter CorA
MNTYSLILGLLAFLLLIATTFAGVFGAKFKFKPIYHKVFALLTLVFAILHIALI